MRSTATKKPFDEMTLQEIKKTGDISLVRRYNQEIKKMVTDKLSREAITHLYGNSIENIYYGIEEYKMTYQSEYLFPGKPIIVYPGIRETHAQKEFTCDFSGARISKGSLYISYRPMLKNLLDGTTYVLKRTLKVETGYESELPTDIAGLEELNEKIRRHYDQDDGDIQYDHLFWQIGGTLEFKKLSRRKGYETRYNKRPQRLQSEGTN